MLYDLSIVWFHLKKNIFFYLFLICELVLCFSMILIGMDENQTFHDRQQIYRAYQEKDLISLTNDSWFMEKLDLSTNQKVLTKKGILLGQVYPIEWTNNRGSIDSAQVLVANDRFFRQYFHQVPKQGLAYCSLALRNKLKEARQFLDSQTRWLTQEILQWNEQKWSVHSINELNPKTTLKSIPTSPFESGDLSMERTVFVLMPDRMQIQPIFGFIKVPREQMTSRLLAEVSTMVEEKLHASDLHADFEKGANSQSAFVRLFGWIAWIALLVIDFGTSAVILLFMNQRHKMLRIQHIFGATRLRLRLQLFIELCIVMVVSFIVALFLRWISEPAFSSVYYLIHPSVIATLSGIMLAFVLCIFITLFSSTNMEWKRK